MAHCIYVILKVGWGGFAARRGLHGCADGGRRGVSVEAVQYTVADEGVVS